MMKQKKAASHVEIIISFVLFIFFIVFIFIVFKPLAIFTESTLDLDATESAILKNISTDLSVLSVVSIRINSPDYDPSEPCFSIADQVTDGLPLIMRNGSEDVINASRIAGTIYFENSGSFYTLHYAEELEEKPLSNTGSCTALNYDLGTEEYEVGIIDSKTAVSYSKLIDFQTNYNENYEQVKQEFGLRKDFNIALRNSPEMLFKAGKEKPSGVEIMAKDVQIFILDKDAGLKPDVMNIQVWG